MKKLLLLIAIISSSFKLYSQLTNEEESYLSDILIKKINTLRKTKNIGPLEKHIQLDSAAKFHASYMCEKNKLTHHQLESEFVTPKHRIEKYSNDFTGFGENVLKSKSIKPPFTKRKLTLLANLMFNSWKKSEGHYKNMISREFTHSGFGFAYYKKTKQIYATHNFGTKSFKIKNQFSNNSFGIGDNYDDCMEMLDYSNIIASFGNNISIEDNEIIFRYHNLYYFKKIFKDKNDGLAIDLVKNEQFACNQSNKLDDSPIYDGVLLKPVYKDEILSRNKALSPFRLKVSLGKIPMSFDTKELSANLILINNGNRCEYRVPITIPRSRYGLIPIEPELFTPSIQLKTEGISFVKEIFFDFGSSKITASKITSDTINPNSIQTIDIKSYTSVDGTYSNNKYLFDKRALFIKNYLLKKYGKLHHKISIESKENWELFDFQLEVFGYLNELQKPKKEKRRYANTTLKSLFNYQFEQQRKSKAIIYEKGTWTTSDKNHATYNLIDALLHENSDLANVALVNLYKQKNAGYILEQDFILDRLIHKKELVQNTSALIIKNIQQYQTDLIIYYINYWLKRADELSKDAQKNLLNLYTITTRELLMFWDVDNERLARVLHPEKVNHLFSEIEKSEGNDALYLNYHMAVIQYYAQINDYPMISRSFDYISNYFKKKSLSIEDDIKLALFFNQWSRYDLTLQLLAKAYLNDQLNEDALFIYAQTLMVDKSYSNDILRETIVEEALKRNKKRWCVWIGKDFQNLREPFIKNPFCNYCN